MAFSEALKIFVRKKAYFSCCLCHELEVEVHHIIAEAEGGPDSEDNAAPLCPSCHSRYGANPQKRKLIREARDHWYGVCHRRFRSDADGLEEIRNLLRKLAARDELRGFKGASVEQRPEQPAEGTSESGRLHFQLRGDPHEVGAEVWIWQETPETAIKLCDTEGWGNLRIYFSPDDLHIILRDGGSSMGIHLRLFSRFGATPLDQFTEQETADIDNKAEQLALQEAGFRIDRVLDHRYVGCVGWSSDSRAVLIRLTGHGVLSDKAYHLDWVGVYDLETTQMGTDLSKMNRRAVRDATEDDGTATSTD
jgi:HNH endonuclease